jgi:hypothetical protein
MIRKAAIAVLVASTIIGISACEKQGPAEKIGEELDEAGRTIKNGGKETTGDKLDDAADHARESVNDAADAVKDN